MSPKSRVLLVVDGIINVLVGILLLLFPFGVAPLLGVPLPDSNFYTTILGAVILGIGIALLLESYGEGEVFRGLGLAGAIVINFCGAGVLSLWLIFVPLHLPMRGYFVLWTVAVVVLALGFVELITKSWKHE